MLLTIEKGCAFETYLKIHCICKCGSSIDRYPTEKHVVLEVPGVGGEGLYIHSIFYKIFKEKTKAAFEVMPGSAGKAKAVLADLARFADSTPFDTSEIIQAGRALIPCCVGTDHPSSDFGVFA